MSDSGDATSTGEDAQFYWRCCGTNCDYLSPHGDHQDQLDHARDEHGRFDAVSWEAVAPFEVDDAE